MSELVSTLDIDTDGVEWSEDETVLHAERRTRLLFYVFSLLTAGGMFLLVLWMILAEITRTHLN